jgi:hypothetical protein
MRRIWVIILIMLFFSGSPSRALSAAVPLEQYEKSVFSQNGEDGVLEKIFEIIKPTSRYAVEFGAADGVGGSNIRNLIVNYGWSALMIEGDKKLAEKCRQNYTDNPRVRSIQAWVYPGNIEVLFEENGVPSDLDLLSIDIDTNDYYVWKVIHDFHPKVVIIEYNASYPPPLKRVIEYNPLNAWDGTDYFGASIQSLYDLGKKKGYELIYVEKNGINLFFVEKKYYDLFGLTDNSPARMYRPPQYGLESGGRAPNGRGNPPFETYRPKNILRRLFYNKDFSWNNNFFWECLKVPKKVVER